MRTHTHSGHGHSCSFACLIDPLAPDRRCIKSLPPRPQQQSPQWRAWHRPSPSARRHLWHMHQPQHQHLPLSRSIRSCRHPQRPRRRHRLRRLRRRRRLHVRFPYVLWTPRRVRWDSNARCAPHRLSTRRRKNSRIRSPMYAPSVTSERRRVSYTIKSTQQPQQVNSLDAERDVVSLVCFASCSGICKIVPPPSWCVPRPWLHARRPRLWPAAHLRVIRVLCGVSAGILPSV